MPNNKLSLLPLQCVRDNIASTAHSINDVTLIAVSKTRTIADILSIYAAGVRHFAENRPRELSYKATELAHLTDLQWHYIGNLQSTNSRIIARYAHCFHAVDRIKIARRLSLQLKSFARNLSVFIQVNITGETSKSGFYCANWRNDQQQLQTLITAIQEIATLPHITILGLMTMAPFNSSEESLHTIFQNMSELSSCLHTMLPTIDMQQLSMGMSGDYKIALAHGASHVRIGRAIFGKH